MLRINADRKSGERRSAGLERRALWRDEGDRDMVDMLDRVGNKPQR